MAKILNIASSVIFLLLSSSAALAVAMPQEGGVGSFCENMFVAISDLSMMLTTRHSHFCV